MSYARALDFYSKMNFSITIRWWGPFPLIRSGMQLIAMEAMLESGMRAGNGSNMPRTAGMEMSH